MFMAARAQLSRAYNFARRFVGTVLSHKAWRFGWGGSAAPDPLNNWEVCHPRPPGGPRGPMRGYAGPHGAQWGSHGPPHGPPWGTIEAPLGAMGFPWDAHGAPWGPGPIGALDAPWDAHGAPWWPRKTSPWATGPSGGSGGRSLTQNNRQLDAPLRNCRTLELTNKKKLKTNSKKNSGQTQKKLQKKL